MNKLLYDLTTFTEDPPDKYGTRVVVGLIGTKELEQSTAVVTHSYS